MTDISWPNVRQLILNDRANGYKPDKQLVKKLIAVIPDAKILGFGRYWEHHWYVVVESMSFPESLDPLATRGAVPVTSIFNRLRRNTP